MAACFTSGYNLADLRERYPARASRHGSNPARPVFAILHPCIAMFDSHQFNNGLIGSMISGYKYYGEGDLDHDRRLI
jgi:hypothetical protein